MRRATLGLALLVSLAALATPVTAWAQCAMCQTALTNSPEGQRIAAEFNKAILVMMAAPYAVFGGIVAFVFRARGRRLLPLPGRPENSDL
jgi:hypothetical protein